MNRLIVGKPIVIFEARGEKDQQSGREGTYIVGHFMNRADAVSAVTGLGVGDGNGYVLERDALLRILETGEEQFLLLEAIEVESDAIVHKRALDKLAAAGLTDKEKSALGLIVTKQSAPTTSSKSSMLDQEYYDIQDFYTVMNEATHNLRQLSLMQDRMHWQFGDPPQYVDFVNALSNTQMGWVSSNC